MHEIGVLFWDWVCALGGGGWRNSFFITTRWIIEYIKESARFDTTCETDFRNKSVLEACSISLSYIPFTLFNPHSGPSFMHSDESGMRIIVESDDDQGIFGPMSIGLN